MSSSRRQFIKSVAAAGGALALPPGLAVAAMAPAMASATLPLRAGPLTQALTDGGPKTRFWGFNDSVPGPLLRYRKGDTVRLLVSNDLKIGTTVHWHGLRVPNAMDGVPFITQDPIKAGEQMLYEFPLQDSGTFWYHPHQSSFEQVPRGLYGAFIVEETQPIEVDRELVLVLSDVKLGADGQQIEDYGRILDLANEGRVGNQVMLNGAAVGAARTLPVRGGERLRLRLINAASARIFNLALAGHAMNVIAYDGQAVEPHTVDVLALGPGMRIDLVIDCLQMPGSDFSLTDAGHRGAGVIARLVYSGDKPLRDKPLGAPIRLVGNELTEPDPARATNHTVVFQGGMRGGPVIGKIDGQPVKSTEMMEKYGLAWTMNLTAQHEHALMHEPLFTFRQGEHVLLHMVNGTEFSHPMHLHGHFFRVVAINGKRTRFQEWRDTVLMAPRETVTVAFVADNLGEWMFHCHILDHAAGGMMGTVAVR